MYFQWRQSLGGAEKFHSAMVLSRGADSRTFAAVRALGQELAELTVKDSRVRADVAILFDWSSWWGLELDSHPAELRFLDSLLAHYRPLWTSNVTSYRLVVVPNLYLVSTTTAAALASYVERGGHVVMSFFSGIVDDHDRLHPGGYPGLFRDLLRLRSTSSGRCKPACRIELAGGEAVATFAGGDLDGRPSSGTPTAPVSPGRTRDGRPAVRRRGGRAVRC